MAHSLTKKIQFQVTPRLKWLIYSANLLSKTPCHAVDIMHTFWMYTVFHTHNAKACEQ